MAEQYLQLVDTTVRNALKQVDRKQVTQIVECFAKRLDPVLDYAPQSVQFLAERSFFVLFLASILSLTLALAKSNPNRSATISFAWSTSILAIYYYFVTRESPADLIYVAHAVSVPLIVNGVSAFSNAGLFTLLLAVSSAIASVYFAGVASVQVTFLPQLVQYAYSFTALGFTLLIVWMWTLFSRGSFIVSLVFTLWATATALAWVLGRGGLALISANEENFLHAVVHIGTNVLLLLLSLFISRATPAIKRPAPVTTPVSKNKKNK